MLFSETINYMQIILQLSYFFLEDIIAMLRTEGLIRFLKAQCSDSPRDGSQHLL